MYFKVICEGWVIDVLRELVFVIQNPRNLTIVTTDDSDLSMGVVSSDGSEIWHIDGKPEFYGVHLSTVSVVEIDEDEYSNLSSVLNSKTQIPDVQQENLEVEKEQDTSAYSVTLLMKLRADLDYLAVMAGVEL